MVVWPKNPTPHSPRGSSFPQACIPLTDIPGIYGTACVFGWFAIFSGQNISSSLKLSLYVLFHLAMYPGNHSILAHPSLFNKHLRSLHCLPDPVPWWQNILIPSILTPHLCRYCYHRRGSRCGRTCPRSHSCWVGSVLLLQTLWCGPCLLSCPATAQWWASPFFITLHPVPL